MSTLLDALITAFSTPAGVLSFLTLLFLELVLNVDNIVLLSILVLKMPRHLQKRGRFLGLFFAMATRILLLFTLFYLSHLTKPWFELFGKSVTGRDLVLFFGGLFLLYKSSRELYFEVFQKASYKHEEEQKSSGFWLVLVQIALIDIVFSIDSVITAVGIAKDLAIMVCAILIATFMMLFFARFISSFIEKYEELKILALAFLFLVGAVLTSQGLGFEVDEGYVYAALGFCLFVQTLILFKRK